MVFQRQIAPIIRSEKVQGEWHKIKHYMFAKKFFWIAQLVERQRVELEIQVRISVKEGIFSL